MSFEVTINNDVRHFEKKVRLKDLTNGNYNYIGALVNGRVRELDYDLHYTSNVKFLTTSDSIASGIYERGIRYLFVMAVKRIYPELSFRLSYSISRSIYAHEIDDKKLTQQMVKKIEQEMRNIVEKDYIFERIIISNEEAEKLYQETGRVDKIEILKYRPEKTVHIYKCDGYLNYMYGKTVPSTGYLKDFKLIYYPPGILIQYPRSEFNGKIPPFKDEPIFSDTLEGANAWSNLVNLSTIAEINKLAVEYEGTNIINICENRHNRMLVELGQKIYDNIGSIRLICIAGPSSSGKTTFSDRLTLELISRGINPIRISLDDYYKDREDVPLDEFGEPDFESLDALDVDLFNENLVDLLSGEEVGMPRFDFQLKKRVYDKRIKIEKGQPIIIEGIHALNEALTPLIPKSIKYKIYISPQAQINLDNENPISLTDIRLIRRIVRDSKYRNSSAEDTLSMWPSVRRGEFKWIYQTQEEADYVFDSFLNYELCVLKKYAYPLINKIDKDGPFGPDAERLLKLLKYFVDLDEKYIPCNSILKEFIGGSCYRDAGF